MPGQHGSSEVDANHRLVLAVKRMTWIKGKHHLRQMTCAKSRSVTLALAGLKLDNTFKLQCWIVTEQRVKVLDDVSDVQRTNIPQSNEFHGAWPARHNWKYCDKFSWLLQGLNSNCSSEFKPLQEPGKLVTVFSIMPGRSAAVKLIQLRYFLRWTSDTSSRTLTRCSVTIQHWSLKVLSSLSPARSQGNTPRLGAGNCLRWCFPWSGHTLYGEYEAVIRVHFRTAVLAGHPPPTAGYCIFYSYPPTPEECVLFLAKDGLCQQAAFTKIAEIPWLTPFFPRQLLYLFPPLILIGFWVVRWSDICHLYSKIEPAALKHIFVHVPHWIQHEPHVRPSNSRALIKAWG